MDFKKMTAGQALGTIVGKVAVWFISAAFIWWAGMFLHGISICRSSDTWKSLPCGWLSLISWRFSGRLTEEKIDKTLSSCYNGNTIKERKQTK